jgi:hypothetical protein
MSKKTNAKRKKAKRKAKSTEKKSPSFLDLVGSGVGKATKEDAG